LRENDFRKAAFMKLAGVCRLDIDLSQGRSLLSFHSMRNVLLGLILGTTVPALAAERTFNFGDYPANQPPPGFHSTVAGRGKPGDWNVIMDEIPSAIEPLTSKEPRVNQRAVLAQSARQAVNDHLPILIFDGADYGNFKFSTRFKVVGGALDQLAGVVFHYQNESNFYFVGASALEGSFHCYKMLNGEWKPPMGPSAEISKGTWHELTVECQDVHIVCTLDGKELIKLIDSSANHPGKVGFCTRADSVSYFVDAGVTYTLRENLAQKLVLDAVKAYPRLLGLKIFASGADGKGTVVIASKDAGDIGQSGGKIEEDVLSQGTSYFGKDRQTAFVTMPLRDRNGDPIAAVCILLKPVPGQTQDNAIVRANPVVRRLQAKVQSKEDLVP
jgi:hypothetical protein